MAAEEGSGWFIHASPPIREPKSPNTLSFTCIMSSNIEQHQQRQQQAQREKKS